MELKYSDRSSLREPLFLILLSSSEDPSTELPLFLTIKGVSSSSSSDDRWFGSNNFDKILIAYNDAVMAYSQNVVRTYSTELNDLNKKVAKKVIRMAKRQGVIGSVRDIKSDRDLTKDEDLLVVRDGLMNGMEQAGSENFCPSNDALKRVDVIEVLAQKVIDSRN